MKSEVRNLVVQTMVIFFLPQKKMTTKNNAMKRNSKKI